MKSAITAAVYGQTRQPTGKLDGGPRANPVPVRRNPIKSRFADGDKDRASPALSRLSQASSLLPLARAMPRIAAATT